MSHIYTTGINLHIEANVSKLLNAFSLIIWCPVDILNSFRARSVNLSTLFLGKLLGIVPVARNLQLPFVNQRKGENGRRNYFVTNLHEIMLPGVRIEPSTVRIPGGRVSDRATAPGWTECDRRYMNRSQNSNFSYHAVRCGGGDGTWYVKASHFLENICLHYDYDIAMNVIILGTVLWIYHISRCFLWSKYDPDSYHTVS